MSLQELKTGKIAVGIKQSSKAVLSGEAKKVFIASDAEVFVIRNLLQLTKEYNVPVEDVDTMKELGQACGININAASAVIYK